MSDKFVIAKLNDQLAAERETHIRNSNRKTHTIEELTKRLEEGESVWKRDGERILELSTQLAAEREKYQRSQEKVKEYFDLLAAEREKHKGATGEWTNVDV